MLDVSGRVQNVARGRSIFTRLPDFLRRLPTLWIESIRHGQSNRPGGSTDAMRPQQSPTLYFSSTARSGVLVLDDPPEDALLATPVVPPIAQVACSIANCKETVRT